MFEKELENSWQRIVHPFLFAFLYLIEYWSERNLDQCDEAVMDIRENTV